MRAGCQKDARHNNSLFLLGKSQGHVQSRWVLDGLNVAGMGIYCPPVYFFY